MLITILQIQLPSKGEQRFRKSPSSLSLWQTDVFRNFASRKYNTTLKSIIPLPDMRDKTKTYPEHDYPPQTQVMALYPDTTSFYRAIIVSGPEVNAEKGKVSLATLELSFLVR